MFEGNRHVLNLAIRRADRHIWRCLKAVQSGHHIRLHRSRNQHDPVAVLVPYSWYVLNTGLDIRQDADGVWLVRTSGSYRDFIRARQAALGITPEETMNYLLSHDLADPEDFDLPNGPGEHGTGHEQG